MILFVYRKSNNVYEVIIMGKEILKRFIFEIKLCGNEPSGAASFLSL